MRFGRRIRQFNADQLELWQRLLLLNRPWEEDWLHWGLDGRLHGRFPPPHRRGRYSVTSRGWCLGLRRTTRG